MTNREDAIEALTDALDLHWMDWNAEQRTAVCSCGGWQFDAERDIVVGEHFSPFSRHVAEAIAGHWVDLASPETAEALAQSLADMDIWNEVHKHEDTDTLASVILAAMRETGR